jgi:hypothetical protein
MNPCANCGGDSFSKKLNKEFKYCYPCREELKTKESKPEFKQVNLTEQPDEDRVMADIGALMAKCHEKTKEVMDGFRPEYSRIQDTMFIEACRRLRKDY